MATAKINRIPISNLISLRILFIGSIVLRLKCTIYFILLLH
jgi:hypothetical protein